MVTVRAVLACKKKYFVVSNTCFNVSSLNLIILKWYTLIGERARHSQVCSIENRYTCVHVSFLRTHIIVSTQNTWKVTVVGIECESATF